MKNYGFTSKKANRKQKKAETPKPDQFEKVIQERYSKSNEELAKRIIRESLPGKVKRKLQEELESRKENAMRKAASLQALIDAGKVTPEYFRNLRIFDVPDQHMRQIEFI